MSAPLVEPAGRSLFSNASGLAGTALWCFAGLAPFRFAEPVHCASPGARSGRVRAAELHRLRRQLCDCDRSAPGVLPKRSRNALGVLSECIRGRGRWSAACIWRAGGSLTSAHDREGGVGDSRPGFVKGMRSAVPTVCAWCLPSRDFGPHGGECMRSRMHASRVSGGVGIGGRFSGNCCLPKCIVGTLVCEQASKIVDRSRCLGGAIVSLLSGAAGRVGAQRFEARISGGVRPSP